MEHNRKSPPNALINPYCSADGRWFLLIAAHPNAWPNLAQAIGSHELQDDIRFATERARAANAVDLVESLDAAFATRNFADLKWALDGAGVTHAVIEQPDELLDDPQMIANTVYSTLFEPLGGAGARIDSPLWLAGYEHQPARLAA
jgi:crotonobetainyl-CoA:carnitine CoA-transferase CaiB-like acyl-CoA transferase